MAALSFSPEQLAFAAGALLDEFASEIGISRDGESDFKFRQRVNALAFRGVHWSEAYRPIEMASDATLRDYFAAKAMLGFLSGPMNRAEFEGDADVAKISYLMADAMLAERAK